METLTGRITVPADAVVAAGQTSTFCSIAGGQLFAWGKLKVSGDNLMYPQPYLELAGWDIRSLACGSSTFAVAASYGSEESTITWCACGVGRVGLSSPGREGGRGEGGFEGRQGAAVACGLFGVGGCAGGSPKRERHKRAALTVTHAPRGRGHSNGYCELGYGPGGKKSSANPDKCPSLEGITCYQVAMGFGHSVFLMNADSPKIKELPVWDITPEDASAPSGAAAVTSKSGKAAQAAAGKRKAAGGAATAAARRRR